jgi:tagaturonate reductase
MSPDKHKHALPAVSLELLPQARDRGVEIPSVSLLRAPETILQLGWGKFMRGFVPDFVQLANADGRYSGRILAVQRASDHRSAAAARQNALYTLILRGLERGQPVEIKRIIGSVSRLLVADQEWGKIEAAVRKRELRVILSNATETGLKFDSADLLNSQPPRSFPGKLTRLLFERWKATQGRDADVAVIPTELVLDNGPVVQRVVMEQARAWKLGEGFLDWLQRSVHVASTLVDRIVVGTPRPELLAEECEAIAYRDDLLTCCEPYYLFAIQADEFTRQHFPMHVANPNLRFVDDLAPYRRRKLRLLNGPQMVLSTLGTLLDFSIVYEAVKDPGVGPFTEQTLWKEIIPAMGAEEEAVNSEYARQCYQRIGNPTIEHRLQGIRVDLTTKNAIRLVPSVRDFIARRNELPGRLLLTIAATLATPMHVKLQDVHADYIVARWSARQSESRESSLVFTRDVLARLSESTHEYLDVERITPEVTDLLLQIRKVGLRAVLAQRYPKDQEPS